MKTNFKDIKLILFGVGLTILSIGSSFLLSYLFSLGGINFPYFIPLLAFSFIYGLLAYVFGDIVIYKYKKTVSETETYIPPTVIDKAWRYRLPFIYALLATLLVLAIFFIISLSNGGKWPFVK